MFLLHRNIYYFYIYEFLCFHTHSEVDLRQFRFIFLKQSWVLYPVMKEKTCRLNRWFWSLMKDGDSGDVIAAF